MHLAKKNPTMTHILHKTASDIVVNVDDSVYRHLHRV